MKNFTFSLTAIAIAIVFSANASAQSWYSLYTSNTGNNLQSLINVSDPATSDTWLVATDDNNNVVVMKMDYTFPAPQPVEIKSFTVPSAVTGQIFLRSGFFDPQGNIFAYGFSTGDRGIFMRIAITNGTATKVSWHRFASDNTAIDDACWAYVNNQGTQICYGIIANNKFARVNFNAVTNMFIINPANIKYFSDKKLCSVVYDGQYFIVSGNDNNSMFYANILNSATLPSNVVGTTFIPSSTDIAFTVEANRIFQDGQDIYIIQPEKFQSSKSKVILLHKIIF